MLMTREMDYALRILRALYQNGQLSAAVIAEKEHIPRAITVKILKRLNAAGLVTSRRGAEGGYLPGVSSDRLHLEDLFRAMGEPVYVNRCQRPGYQCENQRPGDCGMCRDLTRIQEVLDGELRRTPLSAMF